MFKAVNYVIFWCRCLDLLLRFWQLVFVAFLCKWIIMDTISNLWFPLLQFVAFDVFCEMTFVIVMWLVCDVFYLHVSCNTLVLQWIVLNVQSSHKWLNFCMFVVLGYDSWVLCNCIFLVASRMILVRRWHLIHMLILKCYFGARDFTI